MADDIATLGIRIDSLQVEVAENRLDRLTRSGRASETQAGRTSGAWKVGAGVLAGLGVSTAALGLAINSSVRAWVDYDKAIKEVHSITGQTREEFEHFRKEVLDVAQALGVDATIAARGLYEALSAGVPKENAIDFLKIASKTAVAGVTDVDTAVNGLTNVFNAFKIPVAEAEDVANKFLQTVNDGKTTFPEMARNMSDASVPMATLGGSFEDLFAQIGAITSLGTPTSAAFTQVKATINALLNPSDEMVKVFDRMGVASGRAAVAQFGFAGTLDKVRETLDGNDAALFKAVRSSEAFNGILSTTGENAKTTAKFFDNLKNSSGNLADAYAINADTLEVSLNKLKGAAVSLVEKMESSTGAIKYFTQLLGNAAILIDKLSGNTLSSGTENALFSATMGGRNGTAALQRQIEMLKERKSLLEAGDIRNATASPSPSLGMMGGSGSVGPISNKGEIAEITKELDLLGVEYAKIDQFTKSQVESIQSLKDLASDVESGMVLPEKAAEQAKIINDGIAKQVEGKEQIAQIDKEIALQAKIDAENLTKNSLAAQAASEKSDKLAKEALETDKDRLDLAKRLGENKRQVLEGQIKELELVKLTAGATKEQVDFSEAGIAQLKEELELLDEKGVKIEKAKIVKEKAPLKADALGTLNLGQDYSPIFEAPTQNLFDELAKQEAEVIRSYTKRKADILELTDVTEEQRAALIMKNNQELAQAQEHFDKERYKASLTLTADYFGNLSTIAGAFGKKGHKIAQAAAIAQTTIKTYESATSAYASLAGIPYIGPALGAAAAGAAIAAGFVNIAKIKSTEYTGAFARGGIIGGNSFEGDKLTASVNSGEMIFNRGQQKKLLDIASGDSSPDGKTGITVIVQNLPGQDVDVSRSEDGKLITLAVRQAKAELAKEARQGGGNVFPAFAQTHGLKRKG